MNIRARPTVWIIDFVDTGHPALLRMWDKRQIGYLAMGYRLQQSVAQEKQPWTFH